MAEIFNNFDRQPKAVSSQRWKNEAATAPSASKR